MLYQEATELLSSSYFFLVPALCGVVYGLLPNLERMPGMVDRGIWFKLYGFIGVAAPGNGAYHFRTESYQVIAPVWLDR